MSMRPLSIATMTPATPPSSLGYPPRVEWVSLADLIIDDEYQREISSTGVGNVRKIATEFNWLHFAPLICAELPEGKYAVIDGQHRATAALLIGLERVPAMIASATRAEQARAFQAINQNITQVHPLYAHRAAVAAGEGEAVALQDATAAAGVTILRYPKAIDQMRPGETMSIVTLRKCFRMYGRDALIAALQCVTETKNNKRGALTATVIKGVCAALDLYRPWLTAGAVLLDAAGGIDFADLEKRSRGVGGATWFTNELARLLRDRMPAGAQVQTAACDVGRPAPAPQRPKATAREVPAVRTSRAVPAPPPEVKRSRLSYDPGKGMVPKMSFGPNEQQDLIEQAVRDGKINPVKSGFAIGAHPSETPPQLGGSLNGSRRK